MRYCIELSKEDIRLAADEAKAVLRPKDVMIDDNLLLFGSKEKDLAGLSERLAYARKLSRVLFATSAADTERAMEVFPWKDEYRDDFSLKIIRHPGAIIPRGHDEKHMSGFIWRAVDRPAVRLDDANTQIELHHTENNVYCLKVSCVMKGGFEERKAHRRPALHPTSMHPKLARAMVNLTGIREGKIVDPFCGSGGILIEAGLMGLEVAGYDIDGGMLERCRKNLEHYGIKGYSIGLKDATRMEEDIDYVVTDLPYGRNSKAGDMGTLYAGFLKNLKRILKKKAVISFPDSIDAIRLAEEAGFRIVDEYSHYLHRSLSKKILVLE